MEFERCERLRAQFFMDCVIGSFFLLPEAASHGDFLRTERVDQQLILNYLVDSRLSVKGSVKLFLLGPIRYQTLAVQMDFNEKEE